MVEGQDDVVFFEYVVHELYKNEFAGLAVAVCQYAGSAASGIVTGDLDVTNVSAVQRYVHWIRDRDAQPKSAPAADASAFVKAILKAGQSATLLAKREIEFYVPEAVYVDAQKGNPKKEAAVRAILRGDQSTKLRKAFGAADCNVDRGSHLRNGLKKHLTKTTLDNELRDVIEGVLVPWAKEIRGT